jgi:hypothetical protein
LGTVEIREDAVHWFLTAWAIEYQREGLAVKLRQIRYRWWLLWLVAIGVASWCFWPKPDGRFTRAQYQQIRFGMTPGEVQSIMGCPPSNLVDPAPWFYEALDDADVIVTGNGHERDQIWAGDTSAIGVIYHEERCVSKWLGGRLPWWKKALRGLGFTAPALFHP